ncbi:MAG: hypothetical protein ACRD4L_07510 [Pyrinomonadaceae bacterium]
MAANLVGEIATKAATLPLERQREVLRIVESLVERDASRHASDPYTLPPLVTDEAERKRLLQELVQEMKSHPMTDNPPRLSREDLQERR